MIYLEATLDNGSIINNAHINIDNKAEIETDDGEELFFDLKDTLDVLVFTPVIIETVSDLLKIANSKNIFVAIDGEDAIFQSFPEEPIKSLIQDDFLALDEISSIQFMPVGKKKGSEKTMTFEEMFKLIEKYLED